MEQGFDFSSLKWIVMFAVFVLYKFLSAKKVGSTSTEQADDEPSQKGLEQMLEEIFDMREGRDDLSGDAVAEEPIKEKRARRKESAKRVVAPAATRPIPTEISATAIGEDEAADRHELVEDFDLQKAVIMSEILTRKYDE